MTAQGFPLDLQRKAYSYVERHNTTLVDLLERHVLARKPAARILDVGCGAGANGRVLRERWKDAHLVGVEPDARAAELARVPYTEVFHGFVEGWLDGPGRGAPPVDAVVLSDVVEHIADPVALLKRFAATPVLRGATFVVSVPNYAVWYNRLRTLAGRFDYGWSGLFDRTHLRFYTRSSIRDLFSYAGFEIVEDGCTPSLVQSMAPVLRRFFEADVSRGEHLTLEKSPAFALYSSVVEPAERLVCAAWPELLAFQIVLVARLP